MISDDELNLLLDNNINFCTYAETGQWDREYLGEIRKLRVLLANILLEMRKNNNGCDHSFVCKLKNDLENSIGCEEYCEKCGVIKNEK